MTTEPQRARRRDAWLAIALAALVTAYDIWILSSPIAPYFVVKGTAPVVLVLARRSAGLLALLASQAAFFWASYSSPRLTRLGALGLYAAVTFLEYGWVTGAGGVMNVHDIPMAFQSVKYWPSMMRAFIDWRALPPIGLYAATLGLRRPPSPAWGRRWVMAATVALLVQGAYGAAYLKRNVEFGDPYVAVPPMSAFQSFFRTVALSGCDYAAEILQPYRRQDVIYRAPSVPRSHVVLVIDESVSAAHLSLSGYGRPTTPWLDELQHQGRLTAWDEAASASVYSNASISSLVTGFNAFPDLEHRVFTLPTIFQFARAMNYGTHLLDGQITVRRFSLSPSDMRFVDDWRNASAFGDDPDTDMRMARAVARVLKEPTGQFIVILKRGNHEPQESNYPKGTGLWRPSRDGEVAPGEERDSRTNTYDNAIRYNLDTFFRALLQPDGGLPRTVGIYTSDHGEMLAEHGGTPFVRKLFPEVVTVPLVMFGDDRPSVDTHYRASHHNIFATVLDLMNVPAAIRPWSYSRSLIGARASDRDPRPVLSGYMFGSEYFYEIKDFDAIGRAGPVALSSSP